MRSDGATTIFLSYSSADERYRRQFETHLASLKREGLVRTWTFRQIEAGDDWRQVIDEQLEAADVIVLLVSSSFIASDYCWSVEAQRALERHIEGSARVVPVIIRPCDWQNAPFSQLQAIPTSGRPISKWNPRDDGWLDVVSHLRGVVSSPAADDLSAKVGSPPTAVQPSTSALPVVLQHPARVIGANDRVAPYHADSPQYLATHANLYHDNANCRFGNEIPSTHRRSGTGGKPRCSLCSVLSRNDAAG